MPRYEPFTSAEQIMGSRWRLISLIDELRQLCGGVLADEAVGGLRPETYDRLLDATGQKPPKAQV